MDRCGENSSLLTSLLLVEVPNLASTDTCLVEKGRNASLQLPVLCSLHREG